MSEKKFKVKRPESNQLVLQITSMADIFTIILVFLLKSFASGAVNITPSTGIKLPAAAADQTQIQAVTAEISSDSVQIDHVVATPLENFHFKPGSLDTAGVSKDLDQAFDLQRKRQEIISKTNSEVTQDKRLLVMADEKIPYVTLKAVLASAAIHGFTDFKLVVVQKEPL
jgi:biopolymer transport protein ExbD